MCIQMSNFKQYIYGNFQVSVVPAPEIYDSRDTKLHHALNLPTSGLTLTVKVALVRLHTKFVG